MRIEDLLDKPRRVDGSGPVHSNILLLGEAPGADEERQGVPFIGASGQKLREVLLPLAVVRWEDCRVENVIETRPPGNRTHTKKEIAAALPDLNDRIERCNPKLIIALGSTAAKALGISDKITQAHG